MMVEGTAPPATGTPEAAMYAKVNESVAAIYRHDIAESFTWPFYAAALAALIAIIPALLTGRRLGDDVGHDEMTREERAADRATDEATETA